MYQKRLKKERRARKRLQEQLDLEIKRRSQLEEALKATGASSEQVRAITGKYEFRVMGRLCARACWRIMPRLKRKDDHAKRGCFQRVPVIVSEATSLAEPSGYR